MKIINTHAHLGIDAPKAHEMTLRGLFNASYVGWQTKLESEDAAALEAYFERNCGMRAFHMLARAIEALHGGGKNEALSPKTWRAFDERLRACARGGYQTGVLRDICGYERIVQDDYYNIGSGDIFGEKYDYALRCDMCFYGYSKAALLACEALPNAFFEGVPDNTSDYAKKLRGFVGHAARDARCRALKVCMAYFRGLGFSPTPKNPERVYEDANDANIAAFQDFVMNELCCLAAEYGLPVQIHAGMGQGMRTSPIELLPLIIFAGVFIVAYLAGQLARSIFVKAKEPYTLFEVGELPIIKKMLERGWFSLFGERKGIRLVFSKNRLERGWFSGDSVEA